jgi:hypothetical protein
MGPDISTLPWLMKRHSPNRIVDALIMRPPVPSANPSWALHCSVLSESGCWAVSLTLALRRLMNNSWRSRISRTVALLDLVVWANPAGSPALKSTISSSIKAVAEHGRLNNDDMRNKQGLSAE